MSAAEDVGVQRLQCQLKEAEEQLRKAAEYGLQLLDGQLDLQTRLEEQRVEMTNAIEALEQEKYSLQRDVQLKGRVLESLRSDHEAVHSQHRLQLEQQEAQLERSHAMELSDTKGKMERQRAELEESQLNEKQLRHMLQLQTETLNNKVEELRAMTERAQDTMSSEMMELQRERMELEADKVELERSLQEARYRQQQLELTNTNLHRQLERTTEEKEEREREAVSCFNALEKARVTNQDLQIQLDQVLQQAQDPNSKGNSLFAELEDKRAAMERQLISVKVQHQSLQKQHAFTKQQLHRMKVQIANLIQLQGSRADPAQLERLQSMLAEKNSEIQALMIKLRHLEKVELTLKSQPSSARAPVDTGDDETYYTDLLKLQLSNSVKDVERMGDELSMQRMKSLSDSQRALELERKLFSAERSLKQTHSHNIQLQIKLEELRHKYEPNEVNKPHFQKRKREKLPVDPPTAPPLTIKEEEPVVLETELSKHGTEVTEGDLQRVAKETTTVAVAPLQPSSVARQPPAQTRDGKTVRICEEPPTTIPSTSSVDCIVKTGEMEQNRGEEKKEEERKMELGKDGGEEKMMKKEVAEQNRREERRKKQKTQEVIHVPSQNTMENECAQQ